MKPRKRFFGASERVAKQQRDFVAQLRNGSAASGNLDQRGLDIYRRNIQITAKNALEVTFPTVLKLLGDELFLYANTQLLEKYPPSEGDWATWGKEFPHVVGTMSQLIDYPYVEDCATLDLTRHDLDRASNFEYDADSLTLFSQYELDNIFVDFPSTIKVQHSEFPIIEIWEANHSDDSETFIALAKERIANDQSEQFILIYRQNYRVKMKEISAINYNWYKLLMSGLSIGSALDKVSGSGFVFEEWLPDAIHNHLISGFRNGNTTG